MDAPAVQAHAAVIAQQLAGVVVDLLVGVAVHMEVGGQAVAVLALFELPGRLALKLTVR